MILGIRTVAQNNDSRLEKNESFSTKIDNYFNALTELKKFNGVLLIEKDGKTIMHKAYNISTDLYTSTYVTTQHQFDIHSISKLMARYLILKYELEGKLSRTDQIADYFPDFPRGDEITIQMLLDHSSGLPRTLKNVDGEKINLTEQQIISYARGQKLLFEPGTDKQYSNVGFELLHAIIAQQSGKSFAQTLKDEIFTPLEMNDSGAHYGLKRKNLKELAKNHEMDDGQFETIPNVLENELPIARIFSTAHDLKLFADHIKVEPFRSLVEKNGVIEKNGGSDGIRTQVWVDIENDYSFVMLVNIDAIPFQKTIIDINKILKGEIVQIPQTINRTAIELDDKTLRNYVGNYQFPDLGNAILSFKIKSDHLVLIQDGEIAGILNAENENTFFERSDDEDVIEFVKQNEGTYMVLLGFKGVKLKGSPVN